MAELMGPYYFYQDRVTLWFDAEKHVYLREMPDGGGLKPQAGVTTIIHIIDKSDALIPWACKMVYTRGVQLFTDAFADPFRINEFSISEAISILKIAKKAPKEIKEDAGDLGTLAHNCLEDSIREAWRIRKTDEEAVPVTEIINWPTDERSVNCVKAAFDWMTKHNVLWLETERKIYSLKHEYAGTMDGLAYVSSCDSKACCPVEFKNVLSLIDWKSSNGIWLEYGIQVSAYVRAYEEETGDTVEDVFILRLGKEDGKFEPWHLDAIDIRINFQGFLECLALTRTHQNLKLRMADAKKAATARKRCKK